MNKVQTVFTYLGVVMTLRNINKYGKFATRNLKTSSKEIERVVMLLYKELEKSIDNDKE